MNTVKGIIPLTHAQRLYYSIAIHNTTCTIIPGTTNKLQGLPQGLILHVHIGNKLLGLPNLL